MIKYEISFNFDIENVLEYDSDEQNVEILEIDDDCFDKTFDTKEKIKEFQNWFNEGLTEDEKISIINIRYERDGEDVGILEVLLKSELEDTTTFANEIVNYLFEGDYPRLRYHLTGNTVEDYWDYQRDTPEQRLVKLDTEEYANIYRYNNVSIKKIS